MTKGKVMINLRAGTPSKTKKKSAKRLKPAQPRRKSVKAKISNGDVELKKDEFWFTIKKTPNPASVPAPVNFYPGASGLTRLDQFGNLYDLWQAKYLRVHYKPSVGTTTSGQVHIGIDFDSTDSVERADQIHVLEPHITTQVYKPASMVIPLNRVNRAKYMYTSAGGGEHRDTGPGFSLSYYNTGPEDAGEIWCEYFVKYTAPTANQTRNSYTASAGGVVVVGTGIFNDSTTDSIVSGTKEIQATRDTRKMFTTLRTSTSSQANKWYECEVKLPFEKLLKDMVYQLIVRFATSMATQPNVEATSTGAQLLNSSILRSPSTASYGSATTVVNFIPRWPYFVPSPHSKECIFKIKVGHPTQHVSGFHSFNAFLTTLGATRFSPLLDPASAIQAKEEEPEKEVEEVVFAKTRTEEEG